jgi:hypothetical protein
MLMIPRVYQGAQGMNVAPDFTPSADAVKNMTRFNERLAQAGALIAGDGLHPPAYGARVRFQEGKAEVAPGSLPQSNGILGGYWMIRAESLQDALEWARQCPAEDGDVIEIRQVFDDSEFPEDVRKAAESHTVKAALEEQLTPSRAAARAPSPST